MPDRLHWKYQSDSNMVRMMLDARDRIIQMGHVPDDEAYEPEDHCPFCTMAWDLNRNEPDCNKCPVSPSKNGTQMVCVHFGEEWCFAWADVLEID